MHISKIELENIKSHANSTFEFTRGTTAITGENGAGLPPQYSIIGSVTSGYATTVQALENLADPLAANGTPPLVEIDIKSVTITES